MLIMDVEMRVKGTLMKRQEILLKFEDEDEGNPESVN